MEKKQIPLVSITTLVASFLLASSSSFAAHENYKGTTYKGETPCPVLLTLKDGFYIGLAAGYDSYRIVSEANTALISPLLLTPSVALDPRLSANGAVGGGFIGYGKYFNNLYANYSGYLGLEVFGNANAGETDYELPLLSAGFTDVYTTSINTKGSWGISVLPGFKINNSSLFYLRVGYNWSRIAVDENYFNTGPAAGLFPNTETHTLHGVGYGLGVESTFYDDWSVRAEYTHADYNGFDTFFHGDYDASDNQFMLGLIYHFSV